MDEIVKDSQKYAFAECLVWQTTRTVIPQWDFQRLVMYTPLYTDRIQKFAMVSTRLHLYSTYLPSAEKVNRTYKKVLQPIVRYQMTIGYDALELLVFGTFLGFYCARLHATGIKEAPDYAVIAIANALKFFDDTDQFEENGWTRLDTCARDLISSPEESVNYVVSTSKMGKRIEQFLSEYVKGPPPAHADANSSKVKAISYATTGSKRHNQTPKTTESQENNPTQYTDRLQKGQAQYTTANFNGRGSNTAGFEASAVGRELLHGIPQMNLYQNILANPYLNYLLQK